MELGLNLSNEKNYFSSNQSVPINENSRFAVKFKPRKFQYDEPPLNKSVKPKGSRLLNDQRSL